VATGKLVRSFEYEEDKGERNFIGLSSVAFSPDGRRLLSTGQHDNAVKLWDVSTGQLLRTTVVSGESDGIYQMAISPDGSLIASHSGIDGLRVHDVVTGRVLHTFGDETSVVCAVFSPDGRSIASGNEDGTIRLWEVASGRLLCTLFGLTEPVSRLAFSASGALLASGSSDETVLLWDTSATR